MLLRLFLNKSVLHWILLCFDFSLKIIEWFKRDVGQKEPKWQECDKIDQITACKFFLNTSCSIKSWKNSQLVKTKMTNSRLMLQAAKFLAPNYLVTIIWGKIKILLTYEQRSAAALMCQNYQDQEQNSRCCFQLHFKCFSSVFRLKLTWNKVFNISVPTRPKLLLSSILKRQWGPHIMSLDFSFGLLVSGKHSYDQSWFDVIETHSVCLIFYFKTLRQTENFYVKKFSTKDYLTSWRVSGWLQRIIDFILTDIKILMQFNQKESCWLSHLLNSNSNCLSNLQINM